MHAREEFTESRIQFLEEGASDLEAIDPWRIATEINEIENRMHLIYTMWNNVPAKGAKGILKILS